MNHLERGTWRPQGRPQRVRVRLSCIILNFASNRDFKESKEGALRRTMRFTKSPFEALEKERKAAGVEVLAAVVDLRMVAFFDETALVP